VDTMQPEPAIRPYLEQLRTLPFIGDLDFSAPGRDTNPEVEGVLRVRTSKVLMTRSPLPIETPLLQ
jgi:hypothetical protein